MNNQPAFQSSKSGKPALPYGRLIFALDATASREATWNVARDIQAQMFRRTAPIGKPFDVQLVFYRGDECQASKWCQNGDDLSRLMYRINCESGHTQIERVLKHVLRENAKAPIQAVIFIGDAFEEEIDPLSGLAGQLGRAGVPLFMFQEGDDEEVKTVFRLLATRSGGAYFKFGGEFSSGIEIDQLAEQLAAIARFTVGDATELNKIVGRLTDQTKE